MDIKIHDLTGKETSKKSQVSDALISSPVNSTLLSQAVYIYLANQRESNAHTKDRGEVSGGGRKPWNQKGTGRARHGSTRSPIWKGGGVSFGPTNARNYKKALTKKARKVAFQSALSLLMSQGNLIVVEDIKGIENSTKEATKFLAGFGVDTAKAAIVASKSNSKLVASFANLPKSKVLLVTELSVYDILNGGKIIVEESALNLMNERWG